MLLNTPNLLKNASWGGLAASIRLVFGMGNLFLAIKLVGATSYGYLIVINSIAAFYVALISSVNIIAIANAVELRNQPDPVIKLKGLFSAVWIIIVVSVLLLLLAVFLFGPYFLQSFVYNGDDAGVQAELEQLLTLISLLAMSQLFTAGHATIVESLGRFDLAARAKLPGMPFIFICLSVLGFMSPYEVDIITVGEVMLAGAIIDLIFIYYFRLTLGLSGSISFSMESLRILPKLFGQGVTLQGANLVNIFFDPLNKFLLNLYVGPASVSTYEVAMRFIRGIQTIFSGAFRTFLQLADKLKNESGGDYIKTMQYGFVPAILMYAAGCILMVSVDRYWVEGEMEQLSLFFLMLIPPGIGLIFAGPLYNVLVGIRDLRFIFRMHLNLALLNLVASFTLIPLFGLYGAGLGLLLATAYNAIAELRRYNKMIGPIRGLAAEFSKRMISIILPLLLSVVVVISDQVLINNMTLLLVIIISTILLTILAISDPLTLKFTRLMLKKKNYKV
tara:strand:+ start:1089 stop:2600 length:1512 start_codon:yes stop_codon:yes gene_type:complete